MKKLMLTAIIFTIALTACKKSKTEEPAPAPTVVGLWKGNIGTANNPIALNLKADNTLNVYNNVDTAATNAGGRGTGTWSKTNSIVNVTYKFTQLPNTSYTGALTANEALSSISGDLYASGFSQVFGRVQLNK
jgi:hypothetical protein